MYVDLQGVQTSCVQILLLFILLHLDCQRAFQGPILSRCGVFSCLSCFKRQLDFFTFMKTFLLSIQDSLSGVKQLMQSLK